MHHLLFMIGTLGLAVIGCLAIHPFFGVLVYNLYGVLRPQFLWEWSLPPDVAWSFYVAMATILSVFVWRGAVILAPHRHRDFNPPTFTVAHWGMLFFAVWITLTYYTAGDRAYAEPVYEEYKKIFIMFFLSAWAVMSIRQVWVMYLVVTLALCYIGYEINSIYFFQGGYMFLFQRGYCGLDNNGAALMLAMGVPLCLYGWDGTKHWSRWGFLLIIPVLIHAVLTSFSRGAMVSLILSIPLYLTRCRHRGQLLVILLLIGAMIPILAGKEIQDRFFSIDKHEQDASAQSRIRSWNLAWEMAVDRPILGYGVRNSALQMGAYGGADLSGRAIHSQYLQLAADSGFVGMGLYIVAIGTMLYCLGRVRRQMKGYTSLFSIALAIPYFIRTGRWQPRRVEHGRDDPEMLRAATIANGLEGAILVFCAGAAFLSLETFDLPYMVCFMGAQLWAIMRIQSRVASTTTAPSEVSLPQENQRRRTAITPQIAQPAS